MKSNTADQEKYLYFLDYSPVFRMKLIREILGDIDEKMAVDIGCGSGSISFLLWFLGAKVHSIDISKKALQVTKSLRNIGKCNTQFKPNLCQGDATKLPIKGEIFDIVCCLETLEHLLDDRTAVDEIARVTKLGGMIILSVPYDARATGKETSLGRYRRYSFKTIEERLGSTQLLPKRVVFWCFPFLKLLDLMRLRYFCAVLGLLIEALSDRNGFSRKPHNLRNRDTFLHSLIRFYRTEFWRKAALPLLLRTLDLNKLFQNLPYSNDVFLIFRKAQAEIDQT